MLDKFEKRYTEKQFIDLFEHAEKNYSWQKRELDDFVKEIVPFIMALLLILILLTYSAPLAMFVPNLLG